MSPTTADPAPTSERRWRALFWILLGLAALGAAFTFRDYGVTWDEEGQHRYGQMVARWYASLFRDKAALSFSNLYLYGGLFELFVQPAVNALGWLGFDRWEVRHGVNMAAALLGVFFTYRLGALLGGPRAGFLSALFLLLTPVYVGHSANNPKDLPFAVAVIAAVDAVFRFGRSLPRPGVRRILWTGAMLGLPLGIRIGGFFIVGYLGLAWLGFVILSARESGGSLKQTTWRAVLPLLAVLAVAWVVMLAGWPWGQTSPLLNPLRGIAENVRFKWAGHVFFEGERVWVSDLPWSYLPQWFGMVLPEFHLATLAGGVAACAAWWRRRRARSALEVGLLAFFVAFPVASAIAFRSTVYDGMRHFLFLVPLIAVLSGLSVSALLGAPRLRNWVKAAVLVPVAVSCLVTVVDLVRVHPYQSAYFNRLVAGGVEQASKRFPTDYWLSSYREAVGWTAAHYRTGQEKVRISICGPSFLVTSYLSRPIAQGRVEFSSEEQSDLHFTPANDPCGQDKGPVIHTIQRLGMPLAHIRERERPKAQ